MNDGIRINIAGGGYITYYPAEPDRTPKVSPQEEKVLKLLEVLLLGTKANCDIWDAVTMEIYLSKDRKITRSPLKKVAANIQNIKQADIECYALRDLIARCKS